MLWTRFHMHQCSACAAGVHKQTVSRLYPEARVRGVARRSQARQEEASPKPGETAGRVRSESRTQSQDRVGASAWNAAGLQLLLVPPPSSLGAAPCSSQRSLPGVCEMRYAWMSLSTNIPELELEKYNYRHYFEICNHRFQEGRILLSISF